MKKEITFDDFSKIQILVGTELEVSKNDSQPFIIGGGEIYNLAMEIADRIELTRVHSKFDGDTFFPLIDFNRWVEVKRDERKKDSKHNYDFTFIRYDKKQ